MPRGLGIRFWFGVPILRGGRVVRVVARAGVAEGAGFSDRDAFVRWRDFPGAPTVVESEIRTGIGCEEARDPILLRCSDSAGGRVVARGCH
ncbi:hypothetical protein C1632_07365 [Microbacterium testaceum]|nr:hypothetical protein C1632_07365 [Microbacterium testaceum]